MLDNCLELSKFKVLKMLDILRISTHIHKKVTGRYARRTTRLCKEAPCRAKRTLGLLGSEKQSGLDIYSSNLISINLMNSVSWQDTWNLRHNLFPKIYPTN